ERAAAEPAAVDRVIAACDRLPMSLAVASARIVLRPALSLAAAADALVGGAFAWTYGLLSPNARRLYRGFGAHPGPDLTAGAAAVLIGRSEVDGAAALAELA